MKSQWTNNRLPPIRGQTDPAASIGIMSGMGWTSYLEDIQRRIDEAEHMRSQISKGSVATEQLARLPLKVDKDLDDLIKLYKAVQSDLEMATDPTVDLVWKNRALENSLEKLGRDLEAQRAAYESQLQDAERKRANEVSSLKTKYNNLKMDCEKQLKEARRKSGR